jgi:type IV secretory pathway TraG/TraD family ATPase VirD4
LPSLAAEGGGQGLVTLACLQDLSQARERWGQAAEGFFTLFGTKVVLPGVADRRTLELISALGGDHEVLKTSVTSYVGEWGRIRPSVTRGTEFRPTLPIDAISKGRPGHALLINGSHMGEVRMLPWWRQAYWTALGNPTDFSTEELRRFAPR